MRLPEFWPHAPILWFARAECLFMLRGVTTQLDRFCHVVASLPHEVMRACADLVETTPAEDPYTQLKQRLLASHQLTPFQRGEKLLDLPLLGWPWSRQERQRRRRQTAAEAAGET